MDIYIECEYLNAEIYFFLSDMVYMMEQCFPPRVSEKERLMIYVSSLSPETFGYAGSWKLTRPILFRIPTLTTNFYTDR